MQELAIVQRAIAVAAWGFLYDITDFRVLGKSILDIEGRIVPKFYNNFPGREWGLSFLKRHNPALTQRMSQNIKNCRASVLSSETAKFFDNLKITLKYSEEIQVPS